MKYKIIALFIAFLALNIGCRKTVVNRTVNGITYLIFGHYYGACAGESCVETYKLTATELFEDIVDDYAHQDFDFIELSTAKFTECKPLLSSVPKELRTEASQTFGCPDCADGGGLYVSLLIDGDTTIYNIDRTQANVPQYLHPFMDLMIAKIDSLQN